MWFGTDANSTIFKGKSRTLLRIVLSRPVYDMGFPGIEPGTTQGWLAFSGPTLDALNLDIATKDITPRFVWPADPP